MPAELWWANMGQYNLATFPIQIVVMVAGMVLSASLVISSGKIVNKTIKIFFSLSFIFIGITFFIVLGNFELPQKIAQGGVFILMGLLFFIDIFKGNIHFEVPKENKTKRMIFFISLLTIFCYPLFGMLSGRVFPHIILFGLLPCSTTAFALTMLSIAKIRKNKLLYILLLIWAVPFPPIIQVPQYGVYEDLIMFFIGIYGLYIFIQNWRNERSTGKNKLKES